MRRKILLDFVIQRLDNKKTVQFVHHNFLLRTNGLFLASYSSVTDQSVMK